MITSESGIRNSKFRWFNYLVPALLFISTNAYAIRNTNMRRMKLIIAALLVILPFAANAAPILRGDFDPSAVEYEFVGLPFGQIIVSDGNLTVSDGEVRTVARGDLVSPTYYDGNDASVIRLDFASSISAIGLDFNSNNADTTLSVFDSLDNLIESFTLSAAEQFPCAGFLCGFVGLDVGALNIAYVLIDTPLIGDELFIDNIIYQAIEPTNFFTLAILPDTQMYVEQHPEILEAQMDWIVANQEAENIIYVAHLGDLKDDLSCDNKTVNNGVGNARTEWAIVNDAFTILDAADIAYGVVPGNHDFEQISSTCPTDFSCATGESETCAQRPLGIEDMNIATFNSVLGPSRFNDPAAPGYQPTYGDPGITPGARRVG